jgi:VWFA-related protein
MRTILTAAISSFVVLGGGLLAQQQPSAPAPPEQPPLTFKVEVNYVELDAVVTDASGNFVRGLTKADFEVLEQSKPQTISLFSLVDLPLERPDAPLFSKTGIEPDVRTNREFDGRVFVLVLDDLHTHALRSPRLRAAARLFVEQYVGANDLVAVVTTGGNKHAAQNFTGSRRLLVKAIDAFIGRKLRSETLENLSQLSRPTPGGAGPTNSSSMERAHWARSTLSTLKGVAEYVEGIRGRRKAVVFFSEGIDYDISNVFKNQFASDVREEMKTAITGATRANVSFYAIDPRGLSGFEDAIEIQGVPADNSLGVHTMQDEVRTAQDSLRSLAEETGGFAALHRNDYRATFAKIISDNSSYYVLGYYSNDTRRDGRFRPVTVRVRKPGLQVRARKGYIPPRPRPAASPKDASAGTSAELREAFTSPLPVTGLGLTASAAPFRGARGTAAVSVTLEIEGSRFKFSEKDGRIFDEVEVSMLAIDADGKGRDGGRDVVQLTLRPQTRDAILARGVRIMRRLELSPGIYYLRIGARETGSGSVGTVMLDLEVPDFSKEPLVMSGIVLTSAAGAVPTARADEQFKDVLPGAPTTARDFARDDVLVTFAEVYDNQTRVPHRVEIRTSVLADSGAVVFTTSEERRSEELGAAGGGYGHSAKIPLKDLPPGRYALRVEAKALLSNGGAALRELEFRIR